jgi:hypothetical protein
LLFVGGAIQSSLPRPKIVFASSTALIVFEK